MRTLILFFCLAFAVPVFAAGGDLAPAAAAFDDGTFLRAAGLARDLGTAEGDAFAARAELAQGEFVARPAARRATLDRAVADARRSIARDAARPEAHLYLAVALGLIARGEGGLAAHLAGYGNEARRHIDRALERAPDNAWGHAALGGWHLEIAHTGGFVGGLIYGASTGEGEAAYEHALTLDPENMSVAWQYAFQIAGLGGEAPLARARQLLAAILERPPHTALDRLLREGARELDAALESGDEAEILRIVNLRLGRAAGEPADPRLETRPSIGRTR